MSSRRFGFCEPDDRRVDRAGACSTGTAALVDDNEDDQCDYNATPGARSTTLCSRTGSS